MKEHYLDSDKSLAEHSLLIEKKKILFSLYKDFYLVFKKVSVPSGKKCELGSGGGFFKKIIPDVITSDVISGPGINKVFSAEKIPFRDKSISAYYMLNVFHHIKNPEKAILEMQRTLKKNGKIIMIEPYNSYWSSFIYKNFHHEDFDTEANWKITGKGRMTDANGALPWIVFIRDQEKFKNKFPNLRITKIKPHTPFMYLLSGGLSKPQLIPTFLYKTAKYLEKLLTPINNLLGMFVTIELEKIK